MRVYFQCTHFSEFRVAQHLFLTHKNLENAFYAHTGIILMLQSLPCLNEKQLVEYLRLHFLINESILRYLLKNIYIKFRIYKQH